MISSWKQYPKKLLLSLFDSLLFIKKKKKIFADSDSYGEENFEGFDLEDFGPVEVERNQDNSNYDVFLMRICGHPVIR